MKLAVTFHPDRHQDPDLIAEAGEQFKLIKTAYETLMDEEKRELYDMYGPEGIKFGWQLVKKYPTVEEVEKDPITLIAIDEKGIREMEENRRGIAQAEH